MTTLTPVRQFEYVALNLKKILGPGLENKINKLGQEGWEAVCATDYYLIFKREIRAD